MKYSTFYNIVYNLFFFGLCFFGVINHILWAKHLFNFLVLVQFLLYVFVIVSGLLIIVYPPIRSDSVINKWKTMVQNYQHRSKFYNFIVYSSDIILLLACVVCGATWGSCFIMLMLVSYWFYDKILIKELSSVLSA